jgi:hypothetical protein
MVPYYQPSDNEYNELETVKRSISCRHQSLFVCILYFLAKGIKSTKFDSDKVFEKLKAEGFGDKYRARAELIQFLQDEPQPRIQYDGSNNTVNLTNQGLQWAQQVKDKPPYLEYRYLQN